MRLKTIIYLILIATTTYGFIYKKYLISLISIILILLMLWFRRRKEPGEGERGPVREELKKYVLKNQNYHCKHCGYRLHLQLHHIVPRHMGGDNRITNMEYLCPNHHAEAHDNGKGRTDYSKIPRYMRGLV